MTFYALLYPKAFFDNNAVALCFFLLVLVQEGFLLEEVTTVAESKSI
jgi:hypothetical protein